MADVVVDARTAARDVLGDAADASSVRALLAIEPDARAVLDAAALRSARAGAGVGRLGEVPLGPPVPNPDKILCLGLDYRDHAIETTIDASAVPTVFAKFRNALIGDGSAIVIPPVTSRVDFKGELALVIGRRTRSGSQDEALDHVAGYIPFNDVSARDLQMSSSQWTAGKAPDTFAPCGPALGLSDEVPQPESLQIATRVDGARCRTRAPRT